MLDSGFPKQGAGQFDLAATHETINAGDFPGPQLERNIAQLLAVANGLGCQHHRLGVIASEIGTFTHVHANRATPDHVGDHRILGQRGGRFRGNLLAVAENRHRIGNFQHIVEKMRNENNDLKNQIAQINDALNLVPAKNTVLLQEKVPFLEQNTPNPFANITVIRYFIPEGFNNVLINIYSQEKILLKSHSVSSHGKGEITIQAGMFSAGSYLYELVIDSKVIESKKMILTK